MMGYRIRYERKRRRWLWWLAAVPGIVGMVMFGGGWYEELARYVGACIRGG